MTREEKAEKRRESNARWYRVAEECLEYRELLQHHTGIITAMEFNEASIPSKYRSGRPEDKDFAADFDLALKTFSNESRIMLYLYIRTGRTRDAKQLGSLMVRLGRLCTRRGLDLSSYFRYIIKPLPGGL